MLIIKSSYELFGTKISLTVVPGDRSSEVYGVFLDFTNIRASPVKSLKTCTHSAEMNAAKIFIHRGRLLDEPGTMRRSGMRKVLIFSALVASGFRPATSFLMIS
jgi:hypothetical protein